MKTKFERCLLALALAATTPITASAAEGFPAKSIRIVVPSAPGAIVDISTRLVGQKMGDKLGQAVIVENRSGASGQIGMRYVKTQPADGYTLMSTSNSVTARAVDTSADIDLLRDFTGVGQVVRSPWMVVTASKGPVSTVQEFVVRVKSRPGELSFASGGPGSGGHLGAAKFISVYGFKEDKDIIHVGYKGGGPARTDVIAGRVTILFTGASSAAGDVRQGLLKTLGVTSASRLAAFPDIPTFAEQGVLNYSDYVWVGVFAPIRTPREAVQRLSEALLGATKELKSQFEKEGSEVVSMSPDEFNKSLRQEVAEMTKLVNALGIKIE